MCLLSKKLLEYSEFIISIKNIIKGILCEFLDFSYHLKYIIFFGIKRLMWSYLIIEDNILS